MALLDAYFLPLVHDASPAPTAHHDLPGSPALLEVLARMSDAVFVVDRDWRLVYLNDHAETLLGRPRAALLGTVPWEAYPALRGTPFEHEYRRAMATGVPVAFEVQYPGSGTWFAVRVHPSPAGLVIYGQDITGRKAIEAEVRMQEHLLDQVEVAVIATDVQGQLTHWNAHAARLYGWSRAEALGRSVGELTVGPRDPALVAATWSRLRAGISWSGEFVARHKDGTIFHAHVTDAPVRDAEGILIGIVGVSHDITARKARETHLTHRATHDTLTGLSNRDHLLERFTLRLARDGGDERPCAVLFLDLDNFKPVNDRHGHDAGDQLLKAASARLRGALRDDDTLARFGGDEFVVLLDAVADADEAAAVASRLAAALAQPFVIDGRAHAVTASIGIALWGTAHTRPEDVLRDADKALYRAKAARPSRDS